MRGRKPKKYKHPTAPRQANHRIMDGAWARAKVAKWLSPSDNRCGGECESTRRARRRESISSRRYGTGYVGQSEGEVLGRHPFSSSEGLSLCGVELASFDDLISLIKDGEPFSPGVVFVPMHRVERMELDLPDGSIPSLSQRFASKTGLDPASVLIHHSGINSQTPGGQK